MANEYIKFGKLTNVLNIGPEQADNVHGMAVDKWGVVLHETVSPDYVGWSDVRSISQYLDNKDYGIHSVIDKEGHTAWAYGYGKAIFYHTASGTGHVNTNFIGIELISNVMLTIPDNTQRWKWWWQRNAQITAAAKLVATLSRVHDFPLVVSDGSKPGVTTHWQVTERFNVAGGHTDCWPRHLGGYFPMLRLIEEAKVWRGKGY